MVELKKKRDHSKSVPVSNTPGADHISIWQQRGQIIEAECFNPFNL